MAHVVEFLPSKCEAQSSNPTIDKLQYCHPKKEKKNFHLGTAKGVWEVLQYLPRKHKALKSNQNQKKTKREYLTIKHITKKKILQEAIFNILFLFKNHKFSWRSGLRGRVTAQQV
jgi:hypothetical protein